MCRKHLAPDPTDAARSVRQPPSAAREYRDLCSTCSHAESCGNRSTTERPIFFCELFEVFAPPPPVAPAPAREPAARRDAGEYKGLCVNCENRSTCALPKPEGGVWHCEEYR